MGTIRRIFTLDHLFFTLVAYLLIKGWFNRDNSFLTAESGTGYNLGIIGGSMMLILLLYPVRKHVRFMRNWGPVKYWFQIHMMLGLAGPLFILFHSNFSLGSTNSNVALISMLVVSGSGLLGRVFYTKIHDGLYGRKVALNEVSESLVEIKNHLIESERFDDLLQRYERALLTKRSLLLALMLMPYYRGYSLFVRQRLFSHLKQVDNTEQHKSDLKQYFKTMLRVSDFMVYEKLFSLWHILHIPLFIMLIISGIVHVIAVHIY